MAYITHSSKVYQVAQKSKPPPNYQTIVLIVLKSANEITFFRQIKAIIKYYNIIRRY